MLRKRQWRILWILGMHIGSKHKLVKPTLNKIKKKNFYR